MLKRTIADLSLGAEALQGVVAVSFGTARNLLTGARYLKGNARWQGHSYTVS
jgi:hypothetical protein